MALEPWNQCLHLDKLKRTSWTPLLKSRGPNQTASHSPVCFEAAKVHRRCCPQVPLDSHRSKSNAPLAHSPSAYRAIYTEWNGPGSIAHSGWPQTGGPPSCARVSAWACGGGACEVLLPRHRVSPRWS